jgi:hypothetical protein
MGGDLTTTGLEKLYSEKKKFGTEMYEYKKIFNEVGV